jgi:hypothetical protein
MIHDIIEHWGVSESFSIKLLKKFAWNKDKANDNLMVDGNFDSLDVKNEKLSSTVTRNYKILLCSLIALSAFQLRKLQMAAASIVAISTARIAFSIT